MLAIEMITQIGEQLGKDFILPINICNPEWLYLGGELAQPGMTSGCRSNAERYPPDHFGT